MDFVGICEKFIENFVNSYTQLCKANEVFNESLNYLQDFYLKQFDITFADLNNGLYWEIVYLDTDIQEKLPSVKNALKQADSSILQMFSLFEKRLQQVKAVWTKIKQQLENYEVAEKEGRYEESYTDSAEYDDEEEEFYDEDNHNSEEEDFFPSEKTSSYSESFGISNFFSHRFLVQTNSFLPFKKSQSKVEAIEEERSSEINCRRKETSDSRHKKCG